MYISRVYIYMRMGCSYTMGLNACVCNCKQTAELAMCQRAVSSSFSGYFHTFLFRALIMLQFTAHSV